MEVSYFNWSLNKFSALIHGSELFIIVVTE